MERLLRHLSVFCIGWAAGEVAARLLAWSRHRRALQAELDEVPDGIVWDDETEAWYGWLYTPDCD